MSIILRKVISHLKKKRKKSCVMILIYMSLKFKCIMKTYFYFNSIFLKVWPILNVLLDCPLCYRRALYTTLMCLSSCGYIETYFFPSYPRIHGLQKYINTYTIRGSVYDSIRIQLMRTELADGKLERIIKLVWIVND